MVYEIPVGTGSEKETEPVYEYTYKLYKTNHVHIVPICFDMTLLLLIGRYEYKYLTNYYLLQ